MKTFVQTPWRRFIDQGNAYCQITNENPFCITIPLTPSQLKSSVRDLILEKKLREGKRALLWHIEKQLDQDIEKLAQEGI